MLIVSRKTGESILIGNDMEIFILDIQGDRIRVGIEAPKNISIVRKELKVIGEQNIQAVARTELSSMKQLTVMMDKQKFEKDTKQTGDCSDI